MKWLRIPKPLAAFKAKHRRHLLLTTRTSARFTTLTNARASPVSRWSYWKARRYGNGLPTADGPFQGRTCTGRLRLTSCSPSRSRLPTHWTRRTERALSIATSSRRTSSLRPGGRRRFWILAWLSYCRLGGWRREKYHQKLQRHRLGLGNRTLPAQAWPWARQPTCRPSRRGAKNSMPGPTCSLSALCYMRWPRAVKRSSATLLLPFLTPFSTKHRLRRFV